MKELLILEFKGWKKIEVLWLALATLIITGLSIYWKDTAVGIVSSLTGVICVILTGKGKLSCYVFGIINSILYAYIAFNTKYFGDFMLNAIYYTPMQVVGFILWKRHMNEDIGEVIAERIGSKGRILLAIVSASLIGVYGLILMKLGGRLPFADATNVVLSVIAMWLSIKRYMEQWFMWIVVDIVGVAMWIDVFIKGQDNMATLLMWTVFLLNAIFMYIKWDKTSKKEVIENV